MGGRVREREGGRVIFFFSSRRRHTRLVRDWSSDVCSSDLDSFMIQYLLQPLILFLIIILIYVFIKKKLLRDEKEDLESLKLLQELLDSGTINDNEFQKKKNRITSKW